jgi:hypothetical protein
MVAIEQFGKWLAGPDHRQPPAVGTVPAFARPDRYVYEITETYLGTYADVVITSAGQIILIDARSLPTYSVFVFLDGLSYQP